MVTIFLYLCTWIINALWVNYISVYHFFEYIPNYIFTGLCLTSFLVLFVYLGVSGWNPEFWSTSVNRFLSNYEHPFIVDDNAIFMYFQVRTTSGAEFRGEILFYFLTEIAKLTRRFCPNFEHKFTFDDNANSSTFNSIPHQRQDSILRFSFKSPT